MTDQPDRIAALDARDNLLWIVARWTDLKNRLRPGGGNAQNGVIAAGSDGSVPIDVYVSDLMYEIEECVARYYGKILLEEVPPRHGCAQPEDGKYDHETNACPLRIDPITTSVMPNLLAQVARRFGHFTNDPRVALGFSDDASMYRDKVKKVLERPAPPTYVGPCRHRGEDGSGCIGELYVGENKTEGECRACGTKFTLVEQREWLEREMEARLMTPSEIVSALMVLGYKVPVSTVKSWIRRKRLDEAVKDSGLYRLADAHDLATRKRVAA
jgi:hypothetical protein